MRYEFRCPEGHESEHRVPLGTERVVCSCGQDAVRVPTFGCGVILSHAATPRDQQRHDLSLFREATEERAHTHSRAEERAQRPLQSPNLWQQARKRAELVRHGLLPPPNGTA